MTPFAHLSSGLLISRLAGANIPDLSNNLIIGAALVGSFAPDIDGLFGNKMNNHRLTVFHTPIFWSGLFILGNFINPPLTSVFTMGVILHLFLDWVGARTCGVMLLYPFSKKTYSLFKLKPEKGELPVIPNRNQLGFWKYYLENKILIGIETGIILFGVLTVVNPT